mgnify:CR=1 FL=1
MKLGADKYKGHGLRENAKDAIGRRTGFEDVPSWYDSNAGVPTAVAGGTAKPMPEQRPILAEMAQALPGDDMIKIPYIVGD